MRHWVLALIVTQAAAGCSTPDRPDGDRSSLPDTSGQSRAQLETRRPPAFVPEFNVRLDPGSHRLAASIEFAVAAPDTVHLLFRTEWEGYPDLVERLRKLEAFAPSGALPVIRDAGHLGRGHHIIGVPDAQRLTIAYELALTPASESRLYHRASQLGEDGGHLIGGDFLPRVWLGQPRNGAQPGRVWFSGLPPRWRVATVETRAGTAYAVADVLHAVFIVGALRSDRINLGPRSLTTEIYGRWPVADERVTEAVRSIAGNLHLIAGDGWAAGDYLLGAGRVPEEIPGLSTGGQVIGKSGIVYVGGNGPAELEFRHWLYTTAHELMHWYIPTGFALKGQPPSWFAEGFTDYMALKILLAGGLIEPQEFLDRIGERIARYRRSSLYGLKSVVEAQADFWKDDAYRYIYDGGAAAAFLLDLGFQDRGGSLEHALREIRRNQLVTADNLTSALAAVRENRWILEWLASGANPDWDLRLEQYRLSWRDDTLISLDGWVTNALSSIRP